MGKKIEKRGRPIDRNSERQKRMARYARMRAKGIPVHAGRPPLKAKRVYVAPKRKRAAVHA